MIAYLKIVEGKKQLRRRQSMKKCIIAFFAAITLALTSTTAYAHLGEYWQGKYGKSEQAYLPFYIYPSAYNSLLTKRAL